MSRAVPFIGIRTERGLFIDGLTAHVRDTFGIGEEFAVVVRKHQRRQGSQSMRYYRGVVVPDIAAACGYPDPDEYEAIHDALAWKFLRLSDHPQFGTPRRRSTAKDDMSQEEITEYIDQCIVWAETSIPGCMIRRPEDVDLEAVPDHGWKAA